jgi:hypothetical protein
MLAVNLCLVTWPELAQRTEDRPLPRKTTRRFSDELSRIAKRDPLHEMTEQVATFIIQTRASLYNRCGE